MSEKKHDNQQGTKHIIRVVNTDIEGNKKVLYSMRKIKGIGIMFANAILSVANVDKNKKAGNLNEAEITRIEEAIRDPAKFKIPTWLLNRRKDYESGEDKHLFTSDMKFTQENDVKRLKKIKTLRGFRHAWGLPLRGQKTKSNFRRNKGKVTGVKRKNK
jgi:small subunit ribosomal protein S13